MELVGVAEEELWSTKDVLEVEEKRKVKRELKRWQINLA